MKTFSAFFCSLYCVASATAATTAPKQPIESPQQIQMELQGAQQDFEIAQKMFIPWYTGPLITGSANNVAQGHANIQPYLFLTLNHGRYTNNRKSINTPNTYIINPLLIVQAGILPWLDVTVSPQGFFKWEKGHNGQGFGDLPLQFGFQIKKETPYIPSFRFILGETFPTGRYKKLSPSKLGLDSSGGGVYATSFGLNISKVFWWSKLHPTAIRSATSYTVSNGKASVRDFNAYGGGEGTNGRVAVGNTVSTDLGVEVSLTQKWVFATDFVYTYSSKDVFTGDQGVLVDGVAPVTGGPSSDQFSISPAIEYNVTDTGGFIGGVWFSVTGRNSANFASIVLSYTQFF
jgi:hypothetical protein